MSFVGNDQPGNTLKFALIGMPNSGKSLLYNSISDPLNPQPVDDFMFSTIDPAIAHFRNEDERMDWLVKGFGAATCEYLTSIITDLPGIVHNYSEYAVFALYYARYHMIFVACDAYMHARPPMGLPERAVRV